VQGICTKAGTKFLTTVVRPPRDFENRSANIELTSDRHILARKIQLNKQLISEQTQGLAVSDEPRDPKLHHRELGVRTTFWVPDPLLTHQASISAQMPAPNDIPLPTFSPPHQERYGTEILWGSSQLSQPGSRSAIPKCNARSPAVCESIRSEVGIRVLATSGSDPRPPPAVSRTLRSGGSRALGPRD
jgi:hypothetical protein